MFYAILTLFTLVSALAAFALATRLDLRARDEQIRRLQLDVQQTQEQIAVLIEETER